MAATNFYKQLLFISIVVAVAIVGVHQIALLQIHQIFSWISLAFFIGFCAFLFSISQKSAQSKNRNLFGQLFLVATFFKMMLSILIIVAYALIQRPTNLYFIFPFFAIYTIYTVYEVYFMTKLAKPNNNKSDEL